MESFVYRYESLWSLHLLILCVDATKTESTLIVKRISFEVFFQLRIL